MTFINDLVNYFATLVTEFFDSSFIIGVFGTTDIVIYSHTVFYFLFIFLVILLIIKVLKFLSVELLGLFSKKIYRKLRGK